MISHWKVFTKRLIGNLQSEYTTATEFKLSWIIINHGEMNIWMKVVSFQEDFPRNWNSESEGSFGLFNFKASAPEVVKTESKGPADIRSAWLVSKEAAKCLEFELFWVSDMHRSPNCSWLQGSS
jgi:hypothetical protein